MAPSMPKQLGGMGLPDLDRFGHALHLQWLWQEWGDDPKPCMGTQVLCNDIDCPMYNASTTITIGNGNRARFWNHSWLERGGT
jgi:hypothetical protein